MEHSLKWNTLDLLGENSLKWNTLDLPGENSLKEETFEVLEIKFFFSKKIWILKIFLFSIFFAKNFSAIRTRSNTFKSGEFFRSDQFEKKIG